MDALSCKEQILWVNFVSISSVLWTTAFGREVYKWTSWFNISGQLRTYGSVNYFYRVTFLFHPFLSFALVPAAD